MVNLICEKKLRGMKFKLHANELMQILYYIIWFVRNKLLEIISIWTKMQRHNKCM